MSIQDGIERVWDIIEKLGVCMLTAQFESGLRARPLEARPERAAGIIWFVTDLRSGKEHEIEAEQFGIGTLGPGSRAREALRDIPTWSLARPGHANAARLAFQLPCPLRQGAQAQRVQANEACGIALVIGDLAFLEGDEILIV
jgi:Pyridoxamine 5'-phosphate oxidase like